MTIPRTISFPATTSALMVTLALVLAAGCARPSDQKNSGPEDFESGFEQAAKEQGVPVQVLEAVAYVETGWHHAVPDDDGEDGPHMRVHGIMGLKEEELFGNSLKAAAAASGLQMELVKSDPVANIRAAAAYLKSLQKDSGASPTDPSDWYGAIRAYAGNVTVEDADSYVEQVYEVLSQGATGRGVELLPIAGLTPPARLGRLELQATPLDPQDLSALAAGDVKPPVVWDPSPNYTSGGLKNPRYVIIHTTEGAFSGAVSWLKNRSARVSAHYVIRSKDGYIKQLVRDTDAAWHARCWNSLAIGIEHEGFVAHPSTYYTPSLYGSSASLVKYLTSKFSIPRTNLRIVGHDVWSKPFFKQTGLSACNSHNDPGPGWNWAKYLSQVSGTEGSDPDPEQPVGSCRTMGAERASDRCCTPETQAAYFLDRPTPWCAESDLFKRTEHCELAGGRDAGIVWSCDPLPPADAGGNVASGGCEVPAGQSATELRRCCERDTNFAYFLNRATPWCTAEKLKRLDTTHCNLRSSDSQGTGVTWVCEGA